MASLITNPTEILELFSARSDEVIVITKEEYQKLLEKQKIYDALIAEGVIEVHYEDQSPETIA